jgi:hypothetical protein
VPDVEASTSAVLTSGRAWEDADLPIQDALADRDAAVDDLNHAAQIARAALAGRSPDAVKSAPYTLIFPESIRYYVEAPLDQKAQRYAELKLRLKTHLPGGDEVLAAALPAIDAGLGALATATSALAAARIAETLAGTQLDVATEAWKKQMEKTYGFIVADVGRVDAERFFPRMKGKKKEAPQPAAPAQPHANGAVPASP